MEIEENDLELTLRRAYEEPAHRPEFYKKLLESTIWVLGYPDKGQTQISTGDKLMIEHWQREDGKQAVPFFSSISALQRAHESSHRGFTLNTRGLFQTMPGAYFVLNPNSRYYWEFYPEEVISMLHTGMNQVPEARVLKESIRVQLEYPSEYPSQMVASLSLLLAKHNHVQRAYLALMTELDPTPSQVLIVGVQAKKNVDTLIHEMGPVIAATKPKHIPVDVVSIKLGECTFGKYFESTEPFYDCRWGNQLSSHSLSGHA